MYSKFRAVAHRFAVLGMAVLAAASCNVAAAKTGGAATASGIAEPAWLDARLPAHTVAYARIPSFWGLLSAPNGRLYDAALASPENLRIVASLRDAVRRNALIAQTGAGPFLNFWMSDLGSPVEIAVTDPSDQMTPASNALLVTRLNVADIAALNARMTAFAAGAPLLKAPFDANGSAELLHNGVLQFDMSTHRLYAFFGLGATRAGLDQALAQLKSTHADPMHATEREIDTSGQGLFVWVNLRNLANTFAPSPQKNLMRDLFEHAQEMAFGWGTVGGRGGMRMIVTAPGARLLDYFGQGRIDGNLKTAGQPRWVMTMMLPGAEQLASIESHLDQDYGAGTEHRYREAMNALQARFGAVPMDFASTVGPEIVLFADANGSFLAVHLRDRAGFYALIDRLGKRFGWRVGSRQVGNLVIHELHIPPATMPPPGKPDEDPHTLAWARLVSKAGHHQYWIEDGNYLVAAQVPQILIDRASSRLDTRLGDAYRLTDSGHGEETLLGLSGTSSGAQRDMYYAYLSMLQLLGDVLDEPVDVMAMPTSSAMRLPLDGRYDLGIEASRTRLEIGLGYEQSPMELVTNGSGSLGTVAVVALLAAIAIPAYQDYTIRSQVSEGVMLAEGSKTAVAMYYSVHRKYPANNAAAGVPPPTSIHGAYVSSVTIVDGRIRVAFGGPKANPALPQSAVLVFAPSPAFAATAWSCNTAAGTTIDPKYRPLACRP